jgi:hypothetical protein
MHLRANASKMDKVGSRQDEKAEESSRAGLLTKKGLATVLSAK